MSSRDEISALQILLPQNPFCLSEIVHSVILRNHVDYNGYNPSFLPGPVEVYSFLPAPEKSNEGSSWVVVSCDEPLPTVLS